MLLTALKSVHEEKDKPKALNFWHKTLSYTATFYIPVAIK